MKGFPSSLPIFLLILAFPPEPSAQTIVPSTPGSPKIGVINFQGAVSQTNEGQRTFSQLQTKFDPKRAELKAKKAEIDRLKNELQTAGNLLSNADRQARLNIIDDKEKIYQRVGEEDAKEFEQEAQQTYKDLAAKVYKVLQDYAQTNGYAIIIDAAATQKQSPTVLWATKGTDITATVVQAYNLKFSAPPMATSASTVAPANKTSPDNVTATPLQSSPHPQVQSTNGSAQNAAEAKKAEVEEKVDELEQDIDGLKESLESIQNDIDQLGQCSGVGAAICNAGAEKLRSDQRKAERELTDKQQELASLRSQDSTADSDSSSDASSGGSYSGPYSTQVHDLLSKSPSQWSCPSSRTERPSSQLIKPSSLPCMRDEYVWAALLQAWAAECHARLNMESEAEQNAEQMMQSLKAAKSLCSDRPAVSGGASCSTLSIYSCSE